MLWFSPNRMFLEPFSVGSLAIGMSPERHVSCLCNDVREAQETAPSGGDVGDMRER